MRLYPAFLSPRTFAGLCFFFLLTPGFRLRLHPGLGLCRPHKYGLIKFRSPSVRHTAQLLSLIITIPVAIFFFMPIAVKRAHDIGHKGTFIVVIWVLSLIAQLVGAIAGAEIQNALSLLVLIPGLIYGCMLLFMDSQKGTNAYGPSTKYPDATV